VRYTFANQIGLVRLFSNIPDFLIAHPAAPIDIGFCRHDHHLA
jgi:hypothetical protein